MPEHHTGHKKGNGGGTKPPSLSPKRQTRSLWYPMASNKVRLTSKSQKNFQTIIRYFSPVRNSLFTPEPIPATYDQIQISLYTLLPLEEVKQNFVKIFGAPGKTHGGRFWLFHTSAGDFEVTCNREETKFYHVIKLRDLELLPMLIPVLENFDPPPDNSPVAKLSSAEVKFDIPFPAEASYQNAEAILRKLAHFLVPYRNKYAELSIVSSREFDEPGDGAKNGKYTLYIGKQYCPKG